MAQIFVPPRAGAAFVDGQGHVYPGGLLNFYTTGTTTRLNTYADSGLVTPNANPVVADANGLFSSIYLSDNTLYKVVFTTSAGATIWTVDPLEGAPLSVTPAVGLLRSYLAGLRISNNAGAPTTKIDVAIGACADDTNVLAMSVTAGTIDTGTVGVNGLDTGVLTSNTWYHAFAIAKVDGTTGLLGSASASSPSMPSGYTLKRRIGSFRTASGAATIVNFNQFGDEFIWSATVSGPAFTVTAGAATQSLSAGVPTGYKLFAKFRVQVLNGSGSIAAVIYSPDQGTQAVGAPAGNYNVAGPAAAVSGATELRIRTDASANIAAAGQGGGSALSIAIFGWEDYRGRFD